MMQNEKNKINCPPLVVKGPLSLSSLSFSFSDGADSRSDGAGNEWDGIEIKNKENE